jgi:hypothetical protein
VYGKSVVAIHLALNADWAINIILFHNDGLDTQIIWYLICSFLSLSVKI